ncbi:MAG: branched-chain amino acid transport system II carrier protein [Candidatus Babeliaceae bacterium]|nr:branched-chain amino acid transport system II carrier protein [Candidatus Babeliaceae bacterium]
MKQSIIQSSILSVALAIFAMLFGSGNIVFPLGLGRDMGTMALYAMIGFSLTAVLVPFLGIMAMTLYGGSYDLFFETIGKIPGKIVIFCCMLLIGPFCVIPRSIAVAHGSLSWMFPQLSIFAFSLIATMILYSLTARQSGLLNILGKILGPLKLFLLSAIIIKGFFVATNPANCSLSAASVLTKGALVGYGTLDLLGAFFFTNIILIGLKRKIDDKQLTNKQIFSMTLQGGLLGSLLLGAVYAGFVIVSSFQSIVCQGVDEKKLLSELAFQLLGQAGGVLASITIAVACLTTAVALTTVFADYLSKDLLKKSISYHMALYVTLLITLIFANYGFETIMSLVAPVIMILYPALIALALANIIRKIFDINFSKLAFYGVFALTLLINYYPLFFR